MDQGADFFSAAKSARMAQLSLLNSNLVVPGYIRRNMNTIVSYFNAGQDLDSFEFSYAIMQNCFYAIEPLFPNITSQDRKDINKCLQDKEWCRKYGI